MTNTEQHVKRSSIAALTNVTELMVLAETLRGRDPMLPGIGVFSGPSGYGKTYAAVYLQNKTRALRVEVAKSWTGRIFMQNVLREAGIAKPRGSIGDMVEEAVMILGDDPTRPLIIDEADWLVEKRLIEYARELHDRSAVPLILIGEEHLPLKLLDSDLERVHNRVLDWKYASPCGGGDARALAEIICPNLDIADDLIAEIVRKARGVTRRVVVNLARISESARNTGALSLDLASYPESFFTGDPPTRGRAA